MKQFLTLDGKSGLDHLPSMKRGRSTKPFIAEPSMDRRAGEVPRGSKRHGWRERRATHGCNAAPTQSGTSKAREAGALNAVQGRSRESTATQWKGEMLQPKAGHTSGEHESRDTGAELRSRES